MYQRVQEYLIKAIPPRPPVLRAMERYAKENDFPIIGPVVGRVLYQLAVAVKARRVLELGSGYGYSAYWFSMAIGPRGRIVMTDTDPQNMRRALSYFERAHLESRFDYRVGDALATVRRLTGPFDIVLNDIDKQDYPATISVAARLLRPGGLFITDNIIWDGRVLSGPYDKTTAAIVHFTRKLYRSNKFFTTILPIRDGVAVSIRL
ncbi:MAG: O-methyltransferase [Candidatus Zixiibacteriota bacterium]